MNQTHVVTVFVRRSEVFCQPLFLSIDTGLTAWVHAVVTVQIKRHQVDQADIHRVKPG